MSGKGDKRRPQAVSDEDMAARWAAIFQAQEARTFASIEEAESAAKAENEDLSEGFGPWN